MRRRLLVLAVALPIAVGAGLLALGAPPAEAAPTAAPAADHATMDLAANTATAIPAAPMAGRSGIAVQNNDTVLIVCGWASTVTVPSISGGAVTDGWRVPANGGSMTFSVSYSSNTATPKLYCRSAAGCTKCVTWIQVL